MKKTMALLLALVCAVVAGSAWAHGRGRVGVGVYIGHPWYVFPPPYYYTYPPPVVIRPEPQVYIERGAPEPAPQTQAYWYYCGSPPGYYPYVKECPGGWQRVVPTPPPN